MLGNSRHYGYFSAFTPIDRGGLLAYSGLDSKDPLVQSAFFVVPAPLACRNSTTILTDGMTTAVP
jgi:hypothetical protein